MNPSQPVLASAPISLLDRVGVRESLERVEAITRQIFAGELTVVEREDFEVAGDRHFTFRVVDTGDIDDMMVRYNEWHARLSEVPVDVRHLFRLSIDAR